MGFETGTNGFRAPDTIHIFHRNKESVVYSCEHPFIEERIEALI